MNNTIVIKSRIRLARNLEDYPFPRKLNTKDSTEIIEKVNSILTNAYNQDKDRLTLYKLKDIGELEKNSMLEEHLISSELINNEDSAVLVNKDKSLSIMINEEDHLRIQSVEDGLNLNDAYKIADKIDDLIESKLVFAFDKKLGYLTSCPTNTGTGMKASVMIHLPALTKLGYMNKVYKICSKVGLTVQGIYGEKSQALGNIYQISNQLTLGRTEINTIDSIRGMAADIILKEIQGREVLRKNMGIDLEDKIFRSLGILQNARMINTSESMRHLSNIKLGIEMGYIKNLNLQEIDNLIISIQPAHQSIIHNITNQKDRDINRANYIREVLGSLHSER